MGRTKLQGTHGLRRWVVAVSMVLWVPSGTGFAEETLTNKDVERLVSAGLDSAVVVAKIESSATAFDTSTDALVALADAGVGNEVIAAMLAASSPTLDTESEQVEVGVATLPDQAIRSSPKPKPIVGSTFREALRSGGEGPLMVVIPAGRFRMGCLSSDDDCYDKVGPVHEVTIPAPFALSVYEVTYEDYDLFTFPNKVDELYQNRRDSDPLEVTWGDARDYVEWLSVQTGADYHLPSEAEWEYVARAGTATKYEWGDKVG